MYKFILAFLFSNLALLNSLKSQHQEISQTPETWKGNKMIDTHHVLTLLEAFKQGHINGHFRYFSMGTINKNNLTDYYANAIGGGLKYETAHFHHFQFGLSGFYIFNIGSSDFSKPDSTTNQLNRYELALFDIQDPTNNTKLNKLEELYIKYNFKHSTITLGNQLINTPFINLQDGRMRPTEVQGIYTEINTIRKTKIEGGLLNKISPRSTFAYYNIGESIGMYSTGINIDGTKSGYKQNLKSNMIAILGITNRALKNLKWQVWNQYVDNIFNTAMLQTEYTFPMKNNTSIQVGLQSVLQTAIHDGGNEDISKTYINKNSKAFTYGTKIAWINSRMETSLNYNKITSIGRYLMPREWGRDPFFTFMPRERNEGLGNVDAIVFHMIYVCSKINTKLNFAIGHFALPDISNYALNKYGMPSYTQLNLDIRREFINILKGFDTQFVVAHKINSGAHQDPKVLMNKVDMTNLNLILNFHF